ncbi:anti-sigma factor family protein [Nonomuraea candida]|uniref:anti-sigma factor family protein n=1 Tax=Nonomuraea candida TaxID=359159 RepID=UPI000694B8ED|nr:zf-HC2 domain-containing protein [Nonomuraea candida]
MENAVIIEDPPELPDDLPPAVQAICQTGDVEEMACAELVDRITDYLEGVLGPEVTLRLNNHLATCDSCEHYVAQLRTVIRTTGSLPSEQLTEEAEDQLVDIYRQWIAERDSE